ncbi:MAG: 16S rRNA processing protein RimM [Deltaproteobacteria bacterium]|nr:16S rRNA processing protein RimM [Deltaproteobacteria bacterium]
MPAELIELGSVVGIFGVRGEVRLHLHNREDSVLDEPREVILRGPDEQERVATVSARPGAGKRIIGRVAGVGNPDEAAALVGWTVHIDRDALPPTAEGEFYVADLLGLPVEDEEGTLIGTLRDVACTAGGARDVWVIDTDGGEAFVVATPENILRVDHEAGVIVVARAAVSGD